MPVHLSTDEEFDYEIAALFNYQPVILTVLHGEKNRADKSPVTLIEVRTEPKQFVELSLDESLNLASKLIERVRWARYVATLDKDEGD